MTDNATPKPKRRGYSRPTLYPARLAVMLTTEMRDELDALVEETGASLGEVTRAALSDGLLASKQRRTTAERINAAFFGRR